MFQYINEYYLKHIKIYFIDIYLIQNKNKLLINHKVKVARI